MSRMLLSGLMGVLFASMAPSSAGADWWGHPWFSSSRYSYYPSYSSSYYYPSYSSSYYYPSYGSYYYVAPPTYYVQPPVYAQPPVYVQPAVQAIAQPCPTPAPVVRPPDNVGPYAQPVPAPPAYKEPPVYKKMDPPGVNESRSFSAGVDTSIPVSTSSNGQDNVRVGFWNVSGRDVTLTVNGYNFSVASNHSLTLAVTRVFTWRVDGRDTQTDSVPSSGSSHEIVIR